MLSVLHIEDIDYYCDFVRMILLGFPEIFYLGAAVSAAEGLERCRRLRPNIVLLDLGLPDLDGIEVARRLAALPDPPRVLALTARTDQASIHRVGSNPIAGMIQKNLRPSEFRQVLRQALHEVAAGRTYLSDQVHASFRQLQQAPDAFHKILSQRQLDLLPLLGYGMTDDEIGVTTGNTARAVKAQRQRIMAALNLHRTEELMRWCAQKGFCDLTRLAPPGEFGTG